MRKTKIFVGSSHPELGGLVSNRLGVEPGAVKLTQFKNKETSVEIGMDVDIDSLCLIRAGQETGLICKRKTANMHRIVLGYINSYQQY